MTLEFVLDAIRQAANLPVMEEIWFEGGEPFLYYPVLIEGVREARKSGLDVGIVTNAWFATTVEDAKLWLQALAEIGGVSVSISEDTFHGNDESDTSVTRNARSAADSLGIPSGVICIEPPSSVPDVKRHGEPILGGGVRFRGRAVDTLGDDPSLPRRHWEEFTECPDEDFRDLGRLHLDAYGNLFNCQGVVIGNLNRKTLGDVLNGYNPDLHPIIGPLLRGGPAGLVREYNLSLIHI